MGKIGSLDPKLEFCSTDHTNPEPDLEPDVPTGYLTTDRGAVYTTNSYEHAATPGDGNDEVTRILEPLAEVKKLSAEEELRLSTNGLEEPNGSSEALRNPAWRRSMIKEINSLIKYKVFSVVTKRPGMKFVTLKWVFKTKLNEDNAFTKFKSRLTARGFTQVLGVNFWETFAPTSKYTIIRMLISMAMKYGLKIRNDDIEAAFLTAKMDGLVYITPDKALRNLLRLEDDEVLRLDQSLYGTKQAARLFWKEKDKLYKEHGFKQAKAEPCLYYKRDQDEVVFVTTWVDDETIVGSDRMIQETEDALRTKYTVDNRGEMTLLLGMHLEMDPSGERNWCHLSSKAYCERMLKKFCPTGIKGRTTPLPPNSRYLKGVGEPLNQAGTSKYRSIIGSLRHLAMTTRPDVECAVNMLASFCQAPTDCHFEASLHILGYITRTIDYGLLFRKPGTSGRSPIEEEQLLVTADSSFGTEEKGRSRSGFAMDVYGNLVSWGSTKTKVTALSTTESELMAGNEACREAVWMNMVLSEIDKRIDKPWTLRMDSKGAIKLSMNPVFSGRTKHIDILYHFARELYESKKMIPEYVKTNQNKADLLTKNLPVKTFQYHRKNLGVVSLADLLNRSEKTRATTAQKIEAQVPPRGGAISDLESLAHYRYA